MTRQGYFIRLGISVAIDLLDLTLGAVPVVGTVEDGFGTVALLFLWGWPGLAYLSELVDPVDQLDALIPTATLIALVVGLRSGHLLGHYKTVPGKATQRSA